MVEAARQKKGGTPYSSGDPAAVRGETNVVVSLAAVFPQEPYLTKRICINRNIKLENISWNQACLTSPCKKHRGELYLQVCSQALQHYNTPHRLYCDGSYAIPLVNDSSCHHNRILPAFFSCSASGSSSSLYNYLCCHRKYHRVCCETRH